MKVKTKIIGLILVVLGCFMPLFQYAHADDRYRDRDDRRHYRHDRYFPREYFYHRRLYYPGGVCYYYDVYPQRVTYYPVEAQSQSVNPAYLPVTSIANMASQGVPDAVIISEIDRTHSSYILNSEIINYLKQNNASEKVIDYMLYSRKKYK